MQTIATSSRTAQVNLHTLSPVMISFNVNINRKDITDKTGYYTVAVNECIATIPIDNDNITVHAEFTALIKQYNNTVDITTIAYDNDDNIINTDDTVNINCSIYCL